MAEVIWTEPALAQLQAILEFIALDNPEAAEVVARRVFATTDRLASSPRLGRPVPEFPHRGYRQLWVRPCWLHYRTDGGRLIFLHVRRAERLFRVDDLVKEGE
jgi:plasmid stabilization system protein ParE